MRAPKPELKREVLTDLTPSDMVKIAGAATGLLSCAPTLQTCGCTATNTCGCGATSTCTCNATNTCTCGNDSIGIELCS